VHKVSGFFALFWVVYVSVVIFALTRIISALFLKDTLQAAAADAEKRKKEALASLFASADSSGDGQITADEFSRFTKSSKTKKNLEELGFEADNPESLFEALGKGDGAISSDEFLSGVKGPAK